MGGFGVIGSADDAGTRPVPIPADLREPCGGVWGTPLPECAPCG
jgi:hypothetical protein